MEIRPDSVINPQNVRISLSGAAFLLFCRVLARPAKKKLGGKAFNVRVCREAVADRFPGIPGSLVETKNPSGKPANCQPAGLPRGEMIPLYKQTPQIFR